MKSFFYGFEGYKVLDYYCGCLFSDTHTTLPYILPNYRKAYITESCISKNISRETLSSLRFSGKDFQENKALLNTAKKLFIYPECSIPRALVAEKYSKSLNHWAADAVVIPHCDIKIGIKEALVFVNEDAKLIVISDSYYKDIDKEKLKPDTSFKEMMVGIMDSRDTIGFPVSDVENATFMYHGTIYTIDARQRHIIDAFTNNLPTDKIIYEDTLLKALGNTDNQITLESLTSIKDMLESKDSDTVSAAMKALAFMDYMSYPNSVKLLFNIVLKSSIYYNKTCNSAAFKCLVKNLFKTSSKRWWFGDYSSSITQKDYDLLEQLLQHYGYESAKEAAYKYNFMHFTEEGYKPMIEETVS